MSDVKFKAYAVSQFAWEYDDQNNYNPEGCPSSACVVYLSEQRAKDMCHKLNRNNLKGLDLADYSNEGVRPYLPSDDDDTEDSFVAWANKELGTTWSKTDHTYVVPPTLTDAQLDLLMEKVSLRFFEVVPVPFDPDTSIVVGEKPAPSAPVEAAPVAPEAPTEKVEESQSDPARTIFLED